RHRSKPARKCQQYSYSCPFQSFVARLFREYAREDLRTTVFQCIVIARYPQSQVMQLSHHHHSPRLFTFLKQSPCKNLPQSTPNLLLCCNKPAHPKLVLFVARPYHQRNLIRGKSLITPLKKTHCYDSYLSIYLKHPLESNP